MNLKKKKKELEKKVQDLSKQLDSLAPIDKDREKKEINLDNIVPIFLENFPKIGKHPDYHGEARRYADSAYIFFGVLNTILCDYYLEQKKELELTEKIITWINQMHNNPKVDDDVKNMFAIEFFEKSDGSNTYKDFLLKHFTDQAKLELRRHIYIKEHGGLVDSKTGEILKYMGEDKPAERTGKFITDIQ